MRYWFSIFLLLLGLACLWGAGRAHRSLLDWRVSHGRETSATLDQSPPLVVFTTVALGGFRGMIADLLWMRAIRLQEENKVFEMAQLADWIAKLEPRFTTVWAFNAWNLSYNISILFPDPEDRWRWVDAGIRLLRDEGLKYNPRSAALYRELGWLYQHKIGFYMDPAHVVYKWKLVQEMAGVFDGPRPDYRAPQPDPSLLQLQAKYKLDPTIMEQIDGVYGPLDWRLPATHAVYWAYCGSSVALSAREKLACEHMLCQCLAESFRHGRLSLEPRTGLYLATPNPDLLPRVERAYAAALRSGPQEKILNFSYANFLSEATMILFAYNRMADSREVYRALSALLRPAPLPAFEDFLLQNLQVAFNDPPLQDTVALVEGFLIRHYTCAAMGDAAQAADWDRLAVLLWERTLAVCPTMERWERFGLAPLEDMRREALRSAMAGASDIGTSARLLLIQPGDGRD